MLATVCSRVERFMGVRCIDGIQSSRLPGVLSPRRVTTASRSSHENVRYADVEKFLSRQPDRLTGNSMISTDQPTNEFTRSTGTWKRYNKGSWFERATAMKNFSGSEVSSERPMVGLKVSKDMLGHARFSSRGGLCSLSKCGIPISVAQHHARSPA